MKPVYPGSVAAVARSYQFLADVVVDSHRDLRYLGPNEKVFENFHKWAPDPVITPLIEVIAPVTYLKGHLYRFLFNSICN